MSVKLRSKADSCIELPDIEPLSITLSTISGSGLTLHARKARTLTPIWDNKDKLFFVEYSEWGLLTFAETVDELRAEVEEQILMLWREFARERIAKLSPAARKIKKALLSDWRE